MATSVTRLVSAVWQKLARWERAACCLSIIGCLWGLAHVGRITILALEQRALIADAGMYLAVGRGMLNGLVPYVDLYENKPVGIFIIAALSHSLLHSPWLGNLLSAGAFALTPLALGFVSLRGARASKLLIGLGTVPLAIVSGCALSIYIAQHGGVWQTETLGWPMAMLYVLAVAGNRRSVSRIGLASIGLLGAAACKEPYLIACAAAALLLSRRPKDLVTSFFIPAIIAGVAWALFLASMGWLAPYWNVHLPALNFRGAAFGPVWSRAMAFGRIGRSMAQVSLLAPFASVATIAVGAWLRDKETRATAPRWWMAIAWPAAVYLATLAVGIAGDYQGHHFVLLAPAALAVIVCIIRSPAAADSPRIALILGSLWSASLLMMQPPHIPLIPQDTADAAQKAAAGIDAVLDRCGIERYLQVKEKGHSLLPWAYTRHSPINHSLFHQIDNAIQYGQPFLHASIQRLNAAQVIVFPPQPFEPSNDIGVAMAEYIAGHFSTSNVPACALPAPDLGGFGMAFRTSQEPFPLEIFFAEDSAKQ